MNTPGSDTDPAFEGTRRRDYRARLPDSRRDRVQCSMRREPARRSGERSECAFDNAIPRASVDDRHAVAIALGAQERIEQPTIRRVPLFRRLCRRASGYDAELPHE
jgi:hypothetical protein